MSRYDKITSNIDWGVIVTTLAIMTVGLLCIYSAVRMTQIMIFFKQIMWICVGMVIMTIVFLVDYRSYMRLAWPMYVVMVIALAAVLVIGGRYPGRGGGYPWAPWASSRPSWPRSS
jgi:rod shape determining protein RodA